MSIRYPPALIHKVNHARFARQELPGKRGLPRAIRPGNHDALWTLGNRVFHASLTSTRRSVSFNAFSPSTNYAHMKSYHSMRRESNARPLFQSTPLRGG